MLSKKFTIISILFLVSLALIGQNTATVSNTKAAALLQMSLFQSELTDESPELKSFSADIQNENVIINWNMNNTNNVLGFELFKSTDGSNWEMIDFVDGEEAVDFTFNYIDETPNWGINFYRIRLMDKSGDYGFLRTTKVVFEYTTGADIGEFFPNPTTNGMTNLNINIPDGGEATIYLHDSMGKLVGTYQKTIESGTDTISFDLTDLSYGIFYAKINLNRVSYTKKIMVRMSK